MQKDAIVKLMQDYDIEYDENKGHKCFCKSFLTPGNYSVKIQRWYNRTNILKCISF